METILRESFADMTQPWGQCLEFGGDAEPGSADLYPWQQIGVDLSGSSDSPIVGYESVAPIEDDGLKLHERAYTKHHRPSPLNLLPNSRDIDPGCVTSSSTMSMVSLPQTPENRAHGQYTWRNPESTSLSDQLWPADAVLAGSQKYMPRDETRFMPYGVLPGPQQGDSLRSMHTADWSPVANSMLAWESGAEGFQVSGDQRFGAYSDETCIGLTERVLSDVPGVEPGSSQHGDGPNQDGRIKASVERGVPVSEPGCHVPGVAEIGVAPTPPQFKLPSAIHSATALGFPAAQKDSTEGRRCRRGRQVVKPKPKPASVFICEECTSAKGPTVSFNCLKDLKRHRTTTKAHGGRIVSYCSCGKGVTRKDAMKLHRRWCDGHTLQPATGLL